MLPTSVSEQSKDPTTVLVHSYCHVATSNWSADYWNNTGGLSLTVNQTTAEHANATLQYQLAQVFERDWNSEYAYDIDDMICAKTF